MQRCTGSLEIAPVKGLVCRPNKLDALMRHRPLSISPAGARRFWRTRNEG
jgi:hypothetical protein